jgi:hypothetical protein
MLFWQESLYIGIKNAKALYIALFRVAAQQLLTNTNTQNRLCKRAYHGVKAMTPKICHSGAGLSLSRKDYPVCLSQ